MQNNSRTTADWINASQNESPVFLPVNLVPHQKYAKLWNTVTIVSLWLAYFDENIEKEYLVYIDAK